MFSLNKLLRVKNGKVIMEYLYTISKQVIIILPFIRAATNTTQTQTCQVDPLAVHSGSVRHCVVKYA